MQGTAAHLRWWHGLRLHSLLLWVRPGAEPGPLADTAGTSVPMAGTAAHTSHTSPPHACVPHPLTGTSAHMHVCSPHVSSHAPLVGLRHGAVAAGETYLLGTGEAQGRRPCVPLLAAVCLLFWVSSGHLQAQVRTRDKAQKMGMRYDGCFSPTWDKHLCGEAAPGYRRPPNLVANVPPLP